MRRLAAFLSTILFCFLLDPALIQAQNAPAAVPADAPYKNAKLCPWRSVSNDLLGRMTLEEKASMLAGSGWMESMPIERLGIPAIKMADGPMGVRAWYGSSAVTNAANTPQSPDHVVSRRAWRWRPPGTRAWCSAKERPSRRR